MKYEYVKPVEGEAEYIRDGSGVSHALADVSARTAAEALAVRCNKAESGIAALEGRCDKAESGITALEGRCDKAESDITELEGRCDDAEYYIKRLESGQDYINLNLTSLSNELGFVQEQAEENRADIDVLKGDGEGSVEKTVTDRIAEVVANAPEDLNTLKEIASWIENHKNSASEMNESIKANTAAIEELPKKIDKVETTLNECNKKINILRAIHDINVSDVKILPGSRIELTNMHMMDSKFTDKITVYECDKDITAGSGGIPLTSADNYVLYLRRKKGVYTMPKIDFSQMDYRGLKNVVWVVENIDFSPPIILDTYFEENANIRIVARNCIVRMRSNGTNFRNLTSAATELDFDRCCILGMGSIFSRQVTKSARFNNCYFGKPIANINGYMTITNSCASDRFTVDDTLVNLMYNNKTGQTIQLI